MSIPARRAVAALLDDAALAAWTGGAPDEEAFLRGIFDKVVRDLDSVLNPALRTFGWSTTTRGIYVHKRPYLSFSSARDPDGCEIGDLLIVIHNNDRTRPAGNALLLQAKTKGFPFSLGKGSEARQWSLYHQWPEFWWRHRFAYAHRGGDGRRHVQPAAPHLGAQYLGIDAAGPAVTTFAVARSLPGRRAGLAPTNLADAIVNLVLRYAGRRFSDQATAAGRIGWDRVVWDLLESWTYSTARRRSERYSGFDAYRVGPTPPMLLRHALGEGKAQVFWAGLPELPAMGSGEAGDEEHDDRDERLHKGDDGRRNLPYDALVVDGPGHVSTIFVGMGPPRDAEDAGQG